MDYASYLKISPLLSLQQPLSPPSEQRNENLFIITHQTYELWFKQLIDEIYQAITWIEQQEIAAAIDVMMRINTIMQTLVKQTDIICTLKAHEFQRFRSYLGSSSGFQSYQFTVIEALLGKANPQKIKQYQNNTEATANLEAILSSVSLWQAVRQRILQTAAAQPSSLAERIQSILAGRSCESVLLHQLIDLDAHLQEWRYRHVKLVERTIGTRRGTGGSSGLEYLKSTLFRPVFAELFAAIDAPS